MAQRGSGQALQQANELEFVLGVGWTTVEVWEGSKAAIVDGKAIELANTGLYSRITVTSGDNVIYRVRAAKGGLDGGGGGEADVVNQWELIPQGIQESVFDHPESRRIPEAQLALIKKYLQDPSLWETSSPALTHQNAIELWLLAKHEKLHYQDNYQVLRHTLTAPNLNEISYSYANRNRRHTRGQLPSNMFASVAAAVTAVTDAVPALIPTGFEWAWLKQTPSLVESLGGRPQVVTEWWLYAWSTYLYPAAV